jgi:exonuclease SbcC
MLIGKLIQNIRARHKANNALKAGLDSLRRYKANADERQQELLRRIEILENSLSEAKEKLVQMHQARRSTDPAATSLAISADQSGEESADAGISSELDDRVRAQAEKIASLEDELRNAKVAESEAQARLEEVDRLQADLAAKNAFIETLQKDIEETQTAVGQLRRREAEVRDLRSELDELRQQAAHALPPDDRSLSDGSSGDPSADRIRLAEHEETIERLTSKLKEYESTITTLSEAADSWKRRYDFLAAENSYDSAKSASST